MVRKILYGLLALGPLVVVLDALGASEITLFVVAAAALIPLAWLIGEATEHAAHHTGPGVGGFLNATFGNAPELIIALFAVADGLTEVVRGSLTGSVVGNLLLVLGFSLAFGGRGALDRESSLTSLALVALAVGLFLIPAIPSWDGDPDRHGLAVLSLHEVGKALARPVDVLHGPAHVLAGDQQAVDYLRQARVPAHAHRQNEDRREEVRRPVVRHHQGLGRPGPHVAAALLVRVAARGRTAVDPRGNI